MATVLLDTPRTNALLAELMPLNKDADAAPLPQRYVELARALERENAALRTQVQADEKVEEAARRLLKAYRHNRPDQIVEGAVLIIDTALQSRAEAQKQLDAI